MSTIGGEYRPLGKLNIGSLPHRQQTNVEFIHLLEACVTANITAMVTEGSYRLYLHNFQILLSHLVTSANGIRC